MAEVKEEWRPIPGFDIYFASSEGRIKSFARCANGKEMSFSRSTNGYYHFSATYPDKRKKTTSVHKCIALAFLGKPPLDKPQINHKNGIKSDNRAANLEYCSSRENMRHAAANNLLAPRMGEKHSNSKLTKKQVLEIFYSEEKTNVLMERYGICQSKISSIWTARSWRHLLRGRKNNRDKVSYAGGARKGSKHHGAKLTEEQVIKISKDNRIHPEIAKEYGVSRSSVSLIKTKKTWKHLWENNQ